MHYIIMCILVVTCKCYVSHDPYPMCITFLYAFYISLEILKF